MKLALILVSSMSAPVAPARAKGSEEADDARPLCAVAGHPGREVVIGGRPAVGLGDLAPVDREVDGSPQSSTTSHSTRTGRSSMRDGEKRTYVQAGRALSMRRPVPGPGHVPRERPRAPALENPAQAGGHLRLSILRCAARLVPLSRLRTQARADQAARRPGTGVRRGRPRSRDRARRSWGGPGIRDLLPAPLCTDGLPDVPAAVLRRRPRGAMHARRRLT